MRRTAVRIRALLRLVVSIGAFSLAFSAVFLVGMFIHALSEVGQAPLSALLFTASLFSVFGALYGTIVVLDETSGIRPRFGSLIRTFHYPKLRALLGGIWGLAAVQLGMHLDGRTASLRWLAIGALVGAILGWLGWRWAKYVDF